MSTSIVLTIEIELPEDLSGELQDAVAEDLAYEGHINRLKNLVKRWARFITGEACHISIEVE